MYSNDTNNRHLIIPPPRMDAYTYLAFVMIACLLESLPGLFSHYGSSGKGVWYKVVIEKIIIQRCIFQKNHPAGQTGDQRISGSAQEKMRFGTFPRFSAGKETVGGYLPRQIPFCPLMRLLNRENVRCPRFYICEVSPGHHGVPEGSQRIPEFVACHAI